MCNMKYKKYIITDTEESRQIVDYYVKVYNIIDYIIIHITICMFTYLMPIIFILSYNLFAFIFPLPCFIHISYLGLHAASSTVPTWGPTSIEFANLKCGIQ